MRTPWEYLLSQYEFMIVFASFRRNIVFYSKMDRGQLRNLYGQLVSFSPARILVTDTLISVYEKRQLDSEGAQDSFSVPCDLSEVITLTIILYASACRAATGRGTTTWCWPRSPRPSPFAPESSST